MNWKSLPHSLKLLLVAVCLFVASSQMVQATPYASGITNVAGTVYFILNEDADNVTVIYDGGGVGNTNNLGARTKGLQSFLLTPHTTWEIVVSKSAPVAWTKTSLDSNTNNQYFSGTSVAVYNRPSDLSRFGRIYIAEASQGKPAASPIGRTNYDGIYILNADQTDGLGRGTNTSTAGIAFVAGSANNDASRSPHKISIGEDGLLYIGDYGNPNATVFRTDPDVVTSEVVLSGVGSTANPTVHSTINGSPIAKGSTGGGNLQLWTIDGQWPNGGGFNRMVRYDINGTALPYNSPPAAVLRTAGVPSVADVGSDLDIAPDGKFFLANNRAAGSPGVYLTDSVNLRVVDLDGLTVLWDSLAVSHSIGLTTDYFALARSVAVSPDGTKIAVQRNDTQVIVVGLTNGIPDMSTRTLLNLFGSTTATATHRRDTCFDLAGNLYGINNQQEKLVVYSPGGNAVTRTRSDGTFSIVRGATVSMVMTDSQASEAGPDSAQLTLTRTGDTGAGLAVFFSMSGTAVSNVDYTLPAGVSSPIVIAPGETTTNITLVPVDDAVREPMETLTFSLVANANYAISGSSSVSATITDNDGQLRYWDADGATSGAGGATPTGTWGTHNFWSTNSVGESATAAWTNGEVAVFSAGTDAASVFTVTLASPQQADHLEIEEGDVTLTGSTLTLTNFSPSTIASGLTTTMDSVLTGGAGLWLNGLGTLVLGADNTYSGSTLIDTGTVRLAASDRIPDGSALVLGGGGKLDLNLYSEKVASLTGAAGSELIVPAGQTFTFGDANNTLWDGITSDAGLVAKVGAGIVNIGAIGVIANPLAISNGTVQISTLGDLGAAGTVTDVFMDGGKLLDTMTTVGGNFIPVGRTITIGAGGGTIELEAAAGIALHNGGLIQGIGTLTKAGPGEFRTYSAQHSFAKLVVTGGRWAAGHAVALAYPESFCADPGTPTANAITVHGGANLRLNGGQDVDLGPNRGVTLTGTGPVTIGVYSAYPGGTGAETYGYERKFRIGAPVIGGLPLIKAERGTLVLGAANVLGPVTNTWGVITVQNSASLGNATSATYVNTLSPAIYGATVQVDGSGLLIPEPIFLNGIGATNISEVADLGALNNKANANTWSGPITLQSNSRIQSDGGTLTLSGGVAGSGFGLTIDGAGDTMVTTTGISGTGTTLTKDGNGTLTLAVANSYTGITTVNGGTLLVNGPGTLAAGSVLVNNGAILGGSSGTITGLVTVAAGGTIGAGASAGTLTLRNGLNLSGGGTNAWELAANSTSNPGADFDRIVLAAGPLTLGGSSTLTISFTGTATAPDSGDPFWQTSRSWTIISSSIASSTFATIENAVYPAGTFSTSVQTAGIVLTFTPAGTATPVTSFSIAPGPGSDLTLSYSGGSGSQFVLLQTNNVAATLNTWTRLQTNNSSPGTFTITPGTDPQEFYRVKSE